MPLSRFLWAGLPVAILLAGCVQDETSPEPQLSVPTATATAQAVEGVTVATAAGVPRSSSQVLEVQDGPASQAKLGYPQGIAVGPDGAIWFTDFYSRVVRRLDPKTGEVVTVAGSGEGAVRDGFGLQAAFLGPAAVAVDSSGTAYVSDSVAHRVRKIDAAGNVSTLAGGGPTGLGQGDLKDGQGTEARFNLPAGIAMSPDGSLVVADKDNGAIRRVTAGGTVSTIATGIDAPTAIAIDPGSGDIYVATHGSPRILRIDAKGSVSSFAVNAGQVSFMAFEPGSGALWISQTEAHRIAKIDIATIQVQAVAGDGRRGHVDGSGLVARFSSPSGIVAVGNHMVVADAGNGLLRTVQIK